MFCTWSAKTSKFGSRENYTLFQNGRHFSILLFPCKLVLMTSLSNVKFKRIFNLEIEAIRANLHGNKRILKWRPFWNKVYGSIVNRGTGYETLELSKARTMLLQSMLNWPWPCTIFCFRFARVRKLVANDLIKGFNWLSSRKKVCFEQGQGQKYGQKHETKEIVQFHNDLHALTIMEDMKII